MDAGLRLRPPLDPQDDQAADDEGTGHHRRREQIRLDRLSKQQPQHHGGHKGNQHIEREALRLALGGQGPHRIADFLPVHQDHREDRAGLDGDIKDLGLLVIKPEQRASQNQMPGAGDRKEFGQALDDAHDGGLDQQEDVHARSLKTDPRLSPQPQRPMPHSWRKASIGSRREARRAG